VGLEGLGQFKNALTTPGIEPETLRLVAYCLNQLRYQLPRFRKGFSIKFVAVFKKEKSVDSYLGDLNNSSASYKKGGRERTIGLPPVGYFYLEG
jgi:hypothetical protein